MLNSFPAELIMMSVDYLTFEEAETLAWTNKYVLSATVEEIANFKSVRGITPKVSRAKLNDF